jgi:hypothetical protein
MRFKNFFYYILAMLALPANGSWLSATRGDERPPFAPDQSKIPAPPPAGAIVLLGNTPEHQFLSMRGDKTDWPLENGVLTAKKSEGRVNHIVSRWHFHDADIHVEFRVDPKAQGNSGVYIHGHYELQILNSHGKPDSALSEHDAGSVYGFAKPLTNAARPAGEWQVYDIRYIAPRRDREGKITEPGILTAWLNGTKVQEKTQVGEPKSVYHPFRYGTTPYLKNIIPQLQEKQVGPLFLQDHDSPTQFRNVWIVPLDQLALEYKPDTTQ